MNGDVILGPKVGGCSTQVAAYRPGVAIRRARCHGILALVKKNKIGRANFPPKMKIPNLILLLLT